QINLSCPEKENPNKVVYISKLINEHQNHELDQARYNFQENVAFTKEMIEDVKFFVTKMNCNPQQIRKALEEKYYVKVYMPVLRQVIQRFRPKSHNQANDASKLYEKLLNKKDADS
ncbi:16636_t:CDS:1, partial [Racocetra persica]